jgi:hypothetical protein
MAAKALYEGHFKGIEVTTDLLIVFFAITFQPLVYPI